MPLPSFRRGKYRWDQSETLLIPDGMGTYARAPGETYLELAALDLDDASAILAFANRHAVLGLYDSVLGDWPPLREPTLLALREPAEALNELLEAARRGVHDGIETRLEFVVAAQLIRDALHIWRGIQDDALVGDLRFESQLLHGPLMEGLGTDPRFHVRSSGSLWAFLDWFFAVALGSFHPSVHGSWRTGDMAEGPSLVMPTNELSHAVPLYELCALELWNHIATEAIYKICKNERCPWGRRLFVYQDNWSRIKHKDALYCTDTCRNAQNARDHRRRKAQNGAQTTPAHSE